MAILHLCFEAVVMQRLCCEAVFKAATLCAVCATAAQLHQAAASPASDAAPARARRVLQLPRQEGIGRLTVLVAMYSCMR